MKNDHGWLKEDGMEERDDIGLQISSGRNLWGQIIIDAIWESA